MMRRVALWIGLAGAIFFAAAAPACAQRYDSYFLDELRLQEIGTLGINMSSDARLLFEQFANRFVPVVGTEDGRNLRDIRRIVEIGGGDRDTLAFLLINLFRWARIDAELVLIAKRQDAEPAQSEIDRVLVY